jgi:hypothetical protein
MVKVIPICRAKLFSFGLVLATLALPSAQFADTVLAGNFGPGHSFDTSGFGNPVGNDAFGTNFAQAVAFTPVSSGMVATFWVAAGCVFSCPDPVTAIIAADKSGEPGAALETFTIPGGTLDSTPRAFSWTLSTPLSLVAGTQYWAVLESDLNNTASWAANSIGDKSTTSTSTNGGLIWGVSGLTPGAYELDAAAAAANAVPEPFSIGLVLGAGLIIALLRKRSAWKQQP